MTIALRKPFPLDWPDGWDRTPYSKRERSAFKTGFTTARDHVVAELKRFHATGIVLSSNLPVRADGLPYANARVVEDDPGVAVWWRKLKVAGGRTVSDEQVIACDRYKSPTDNLHAIGLTIQAMRGISRWGATDMMTRAFAGFTLGAGSGVETGVAPVVRDLNWREFFGVPQGLTVPMAISAIVVTRRRDLLKQAHPDRAGGSLDKTVEVNLMFEAYEQAMRAAR